MKSTNIIGNVIIIGSGLLFTSSFFVKDNEKAVKRRWTSIGLFAGGLAVQMAGNYASGKPIFKLKK